MTRLSLLAMGLDRGLPAAWLRLLNGEANFATAFHTDEGPHAPICFFGVPVALQDDFVREMKTSPPFWFGPELTRRLNKDSSEILISALAPAEHIAASDAEAPGGTRRFPLGTALLTINAAGTRQS